MDCPKFFVYVEFRDGQKHRYAFSSCSSAFQFYEIAKNEGCVFVSKPFHLDDDSIFARAVEI